MRSNALLLASASAVTAQLNDLALSAGLEFFGTALGEGNTGDTQYMSIAGDTSEFGQLTPENGQKWESTEPTRGQFDYSSGDIVPDIAEANGQITRCHTLTWYSQLPGWGTSPCRPSQRKTEANQKSSVWWQLLIRGAPRDY